MRHGDGCITGTGNCRKYRGTAGMTLGSKVKEAIGCDVQDADGNIHMGILQIPLPILKMETEKLQELRRQLFDQEYEDVIIVDFSDAAQTCNVYEDWIVKAKNLPENQFHYLGIYSVW